MQLILGLLDATPPSQSHPGNSSNNVENRIHTSNSVENTSAKSKHMPTQLRLSSRESAAVGTKLLEPRLPAFKEEMMGALTVQHLEPMLGTQADHLHHELFCFLSVTYDMATYDSLVRYRS